MIFLKNIIKIDKLGLIKYKSTNNYILANTIDIIYKDYENNYSSKRILKEINALKKDFIEKNIFYEGIQIYAIIGQKLIGVIEGTPGSLYEKGFFLFEIILDNGYPLGCHSQFRFLTKIFHPNVGYGGLLSVLNNDLFNPALTLAKTILMAKTIIDDPNFDCFSNKEAVKLFKENRKMYEETVKKYTAEYANFLNLQNQLSKYQLNIKHFEK